jgi:paraquat-inducible protein A
MGADTSELKQLTASAVHMASCHSCRLLCRTADDGQTPAQCPRCGASLHLRKPASVVRTWALVLSALILYLPANLFPVMVTSSMGSAKSDTIISGVIYFITTGNWHLALIILVASIMVPLVKILILIYLLLSVQFAWIRRPVDRTRLYHLIEIIGRWSMVDIFAVATMIALVKMEMLGNVDAGPAAPFFAAVVVITMLATQCFDPRLIWDAVEEA